MSRFWAMSVGVALSASCKTTKTTTYYDTALPRDADGDGYLSREHASEGDAWDCDDTDPTVYPDAPEICDGKNNDCDAGVDEDAVDAVSYFRDADGDGFGDGSTEVVQCDRPPGYVERADDCDDSQASANPDAVEICGDGIDQDCDGDPLECRVVGSIGAGDAGLRLLGVAAGDRLGSSVAVMEDVAGTRPATLLLGAPGHDERGADAGGVWLISEVSSAEVALPAGAVTVNGIRAGGNVGAAVGVLNDGDGDGFSEVLVGAPGGTAGGIDSGDVFLLRGPITADVGLFDADLRLIGELSYDVAGAHVSGAGDLTGDGLADIVVGATGFGDGGFQSRGAVYVVSGSLSGNVDLSRASGRVFGESRYDRVGSSVCGSDDIDGDGVDDLVFGASSWSANSGRGALMVVSGPVAGNVSAADAELVISGSEDGGAAGSDFAMGDNDGDGHTDFAVVVSGIDGDFAGRSGVAVFAGPLSADASVADADAWVTAPGAGDALGAQVAMNGDFDADGRADLLVGTPSFGSGGVAGLHYGPVSGVRDLSAADVVMSAMLSGDKLGSAVSLEGDVDGDGFDDAVVGAEGLDSSGLDAGGVFVFFGSSW